MASGLATVTGAALACTDADDVAPTRPYVAEQEAAGPIDGAAGHPGAVGVGERCAARPDRRR